MKKTKIFKQYVYVVYIQLFKYSITRFKSLVPGSGQIHARFMRTTTNSDDGSGTRNQCFQVFEIPLSIEIFDVQVVSQNIISGIPDGPQTTNYYYYSQVFIKWKQAAAAADKTQRTTKNREIDWSCDKVNR